MSLQRISVFTVLSQFLNSCAVTGKQELRLALRTCTRYGTIFDAISFCVSFYGIRSFGKK